MYQFRDPIHGFIEVSALEMKIIDSAPFQRLRNIKQLATTYLVYPGAEHTRFGHSLGVMHLVSRAFDSALENYKKSTGYELFDPVKTAWYRQILRLIGLTHDLGHAPFSHASEDLFGEGLEHEDFTKKVLYETEIARFIQDIGEEFCSKQGLGEEYSMTPELIWLIYGGKNLELQTQYLVPDYLFLKSFMDSELDCDKMDYLLRDSYYCGVNYGKYDLERLLSSLNVYYFKEHKIMQLAVEEGGIHAFEEFVIARYFMFIQVYFHKTRRYLDKLLVENLADILPKGKYPDDINEYLKWDDQTVIGKIKQRQRENTIADKFIKRQVMTCVYETDPHLRSENDSNLFRIVKKQLKEDLGCDIFADEVSKSPHKIPLLQEYDDSGGKGIPILVPYRDKPKSATAASILLQSLGKEINIKRLYVEKKHAERARTIVNKLYPAEGDEK